MTENNIIKFYVSSNMGDENGSLFRTYIWGIKGIDNLLKLNYQNYGADMKLILFQFYVNPIEYELQSLKDIEEYRKKEKAIGIPIIITNKDFFSKNERERFLSLKNSILKKIELLSITIEERKLDTDINLLKSDIENKLKNIGSE